MVLASLFAAILTGHGWLAPCFSRQLTAFLHRLCHAQARRSGVFPDVRAAILAALDEYDPSLPPPVTCSRMSTTHP